MMLSEIHPRECSEGVNCTAKVFFYFIRSLVELPGSCLVLLRVRGGRVVNDPLNTTKSHSTMTYPRSRSRQGLCIGYRRRDRRPITESENTA